MSCLSGFAPKKAFETNLVVKIVEENEDHKSDNVNLAGFHFLNPVKTIFDFDGNGDDEDRHHHHC